VFPLAYWARSNESPDKSGWQLLKDHLAGVASDAARFAESFGAADLARLAGLCHDLGKYSPEFQRRLEDPNVHVDHSTAGATVAFTQYGAIGRLVAYAIAGHHSGLPNGGGSQEGDLFYRVKHKELADFSVYLREISLPSTVSPVAIKPQTCHPGFSAGFFVRMLFSCLVDADHLDAERFLDPDSSRQRIGTGSLTVLHDRLQEHLQMVTANAPPSLVNQRRADVLRDSLEAAEQAPGLFTLTVPTGGAKTLSSLAFALKHAIRNHLSRVIYVIPFTSIIEQNAAVFRKAVGDEAVLEHHSNVAPANDSEDRCPTPAELAEQNWDMPIVVTTNVQFFESLFSNRPSRSRKLHNIAKSVIVLDEAQMLPVELLRPCVAAIAELVSNYGATVVLCSATQPALQGLLPEDLEPREIVRNPGALYRSLKRVEVRRLGVLEDASIAQEILDREQALCIVNTRAHARQLFQLVGQADGHYHLSAAMCPKHRTTCLDEIRYRLKSGMRCRVVSTQLIEAGVDVDFPVVMRAVAGIDSIAQAAGRCNREGKLKSGEVLVFTPAGGHGMSHVWFQRTASIAASILEEADDPLSLDAVRRYFRDLYFYEAGADSACLRSSGLDVHRIMERMEIGASALDFPFRDIADLFKIIGDDTVGVVVPYDDACLKAIDRIRVMGVTRDRVWRLQPYTVSVRPWEYRCLQKSGLIEDVGGILVLSDMNAYDIEAYGLAVPSDDKTGGEAWIV
jgi:CRISPR-associated helicase Cas3/CRISPR-associated endonuclease Cas3-HD